MRAAPGGLLSYLPSVALIGLLAWTGVGDEWLHRDLGAALTLLLGLTLLIALAAVHRPHSGALLGFGALGIPAGLEWNWPASTCIAVFLGALLAEAVRRPLERRRGSPLPERRGWGRAIERSGLAGLGALAAGLVWQATGGAQGTELASVGALAALAAIAPAMLFEIGVRRIGRREPLSDAVRAVLPLAFDLAGFALGLVAVSVVREASETLGVVTLVAFALLTGEAARQELRADATSRSLAEAERVSRAGAAMVAGGSELERLARRIFDQCAELVPLSYVALALDSEESGPVRFWAGPDGELQTGEPEPSPYPAPLPGFHRRAEWSIFAPVLLAHADRQATLQLWCDPRRLEPTAELSLQALVPQMSAAVREAFVEREATIDRLTGAATRRALERRLAEAFSICHEEGRSLALVMADLDHFKRINDLHGHPLGDRALAAVAAVLLGPMRGRDLCARFGGEEFVLVLEDTTGEIALEIAERLRRKIEICDLRAGGERVALTMSFGVAAFPELPVRSIEELLEVADAALYTAKRLGRNLALLDSGGGKLRTGGGGEVEVESTAAAEPPVFFA